MTTVLLKKREWMTGLRSACEWCDVIQLFMCGKSSDVVLFKSMKTDLIESDDLRTLLKRWGPNLGMLLEWIDVACENARSNPELPIEFTIPDLQLSKFADAWHGFLLDNVETSEIQELRQQCMDCTALIRQLLDTVAAQQRRHDDDHSSYSDYSASDTESDESEEEEQDDESFDQDDEDDANAFKSPEPRQRYFRKR